MQKEIDEARKNLEIHSPSKLTERLLGIPLGQGVVEGIKKSANDVAGTIESIVDDA